MSVDDETEERILEKATYVEEAVAVLSRKRELDEAAYAAEREERSIVEREFQTAIEACIDVAELLLKAEGVDMPSTNAGKFLRLGELDVLSPETVESMEEAAGFRNVLAHRYGHDIDDSLVYRSLQNDLHWFPSYLREIRTYLVDA